MQYDMSKIEVADRVLQQRDREIKVSAIWSTMKIVVLVLVLLAAAGAAFKGYHWFQSKFDIMDAQNAALLEENRKYQKITTEINGQLVELKNQVRAGTDIVTSGQMNDLIDELKDRDDNRYDAMMDLIEKNNEDIKNVGDISAQANENLSLELKKMSDHTYKQGTGDPNEQYFKKIMMKEKDVDGNVVEIAAGWAIFYPNREDGEKWKTGIYPLEFKSKVIQSEQEDGQWNTYVEMWAENNKDNASEGKELPLDVVVAQFKQQRIKNKKFFVWNPRVNLNAGFGFDQTMDSKFGAGLSFSFMGYGRTKNDQTWQFLDIGINSNGEDTWFSFAPFGYNIGEHIPLIENTFIKPFVGMDMEGEFIGGFNISIPF